MARERKKDVWRRRLLGSQDRDTAASSQADDSKSVSSTSELAPTVLSPPRASTPDPTPTKQLEALEIQHKEPETPNDVWAAAFRKFQEGDGDLAKAYAKAINSAHEEDTAEFDVAFAVSTVERLAKERDEKQWKLAFAGKSIHIRSQVEKMVKFLLWTDTVVKPALSSQPYAALAWSAISILLPLLNVGTELHYKLLNGLEGINHILVFWRISETSVYPFRGNASKDFYNVFVDLHHRIIRYYAYAVRHLSVAQASRAKENLIGWNGWEAETKSINDFNQDCQTYLEAAQRKTFQDSMETQFVEIHNSRLALKDIARTLEEIQFQYEDQTEGEILKSLHADFKGHKNANPGRVQGTCEWVLQHPKFEDWRESETSSLLWISAGPGYGKSVLSRALIDENLLRSSARAATSSVCYFFFEDGDEKRMRACDAIAALLHQLFAQDLTGNLIKKAKTPYHRAGAGLRDSFDELCDILTSCIYSPDAGEIICVLDAFDECEASERKKIAAYLRKFYQTFQHDSPTVSSLKLIITSRNWGDIKFSLEGLFVSDHPSRNAHINGDEALSKIREEIELVIEGNLPTIAGHLSESDQEYLEKRMKDMKNRTYIWLRLFFQMIREKPTKYRKKTEIIDLLESLPSEVSEVYEKILQPFYHDDKTKVLLQLMLAAPRPLRLREVNEALTIFWKNTNQWKSIKDFYNDCWGRDFESVVQDLTGSLVVVTVNDFDVRELSFLHQTLREFLLGPKPTPRSWKGRFSYPETQTTMLSACLKSLPILQLKNNGSDADFLTYAVHNWPKHYELQDYDNKEELYNQVRLLCDITQPNAIAWLKRERAWNHFFWHKLKTTNFNNLIIPAFFGLAHLVEKIIQTDAVYFSQARANMACSLRAASWNGQLEVVKALVRNNADINYDPLGIGSPIECAIDSGEIETVEFLLTCTPAPLITKEALASAARNSDGIRIFNLIFQRLPDTQVPPELLESAARNTSCGGHILKLLLHERPALKPSDQTIYSAIANGNCGLDVLDVLLSRRPDLHVTEKMVEKTCGRLNGALEVLKFLYERSSDTQMSDLALVLAAGNRKLGLDIVKYLSEKHPDLKIPAEAFCAAARNREISVEMLRLLFGIEVGKQVTTDLIFSAMHNPGRGSATLDFLACRDGFSFTQGCLETWFQNHEARSRFFYLNAGHLMRLSGDDITITEIMMKEVASWSSYEVKIFVETIGTEFPIFITDELYNRSYQACQASRRSEDRYSLTSERYEVMALLLGTQGCDIQMKGTDGHRLTKDEAVEKLDSWKRELRSFYTTDTRSFDICPV